MRTNERANVRSLFAPTRRSLVAILAHPSFGPSGTGLSIPTPVSADPNKARRDSFGRDLPHYVLSVNMASTALLAADFAALSREAGRRHSDVRDVSSSRPLSKVPPSWAEPFPSPRKQAADAAHQLLKQATQQSMLELHAGGSCPHWERAIPPLTPPDVAADPPPTSHPLYQPVFLAANTKNAKVIALAMSALQRLIMANAVPRVSRRRFAE